MAWMENGETDDFELAAYKHALSNRAPSVFLWRGPGGYMLMRRTRSQLIRAAGSTSRNHLDCCCHAWKSDWARATK